MAAPLTAFRLVLTLAVALAAVALASFATSAPAAPTPAGEAWIGQNAAGKLIPVIGRYRGDDGRSFVFDRSAPQPLLKFDDNPEVWVLQPAPGPRGDTIYRNDLGEPVLRATRLGGMTVFTDQRPDGSAAALDGTSSPLHLPQLGPTVLLGRFYLASVRASRAAQHQIAFETREDATPETAALLADTALVISTAIVETAIRPNGKAILSRINTVIIAQGDKPSAVLQKGVVTVTIVTAEGFAGRPSSSRIERVTWGR